MSRPSPAILVSILLHGAVGALLVWAVTQPRPQAEPLEPSVAVSIISETETVEAAPGENPTDEVVPETETAPPPPPEPVPPPPTPRPTQRPQPVQPPRPPQRPVTQPREEPSLNTEDLVSGKRRRADRDNRRNLPPSGDRGQGEAPRAIGRASMQSIVDQVHPVFSCTLPGVEAVTVRVFVTLDETGRIVGSPRLDRPRSDPAYRVVSESVVRGIRAAAPFDMPAGYDQQQLTFSFSAATFCP